MNTPARKRRRHPLTALVLWLGVSLTASLLALVLVATAAPADAQLDNAYTQGMDQGYRLCRNDREAQP